MGCMIADTMKKDPQEEYQSVEVMRKPTSHVHLYQALLLQETQARLLCPEVQAKGV